VKLTANEARELAQSFRNVSVSLGNYRFNHWDTLTKPQRDTIESMEWTLLNTSSDFITFAVGLTLDEAQASLERIQEATTKAKKAIETIESIRKVITIAGAVIKLGAAIVTKDPGMIVTAINDVLKVATSEG
jgi:hypothetical protein